MKRSTIVKRFLDENALPHLAALYQPHMEVQVNVAADGGTRTEGEYKGKRWHGWTDGITTWKSFRIDDIKRDRQIRWDFDAHVEAIGLTGWSWKVQASTFVGFDFDALVGHARGLSDRELADVEAAVREVDWATLRRSKSGRGLHLYVFFNKPVPTKNRAEHAALARAVLAKLETATGHPLRAKVDTLGGVLWIWHRKVGPGGFKLVVAGKTIDPPKNWKAHIDVVTGARTKLKPPTNTPAFAELIKRMRHLNLDRDHRRLIQWLEEHPATWWWDPDHHMLVCHTYNLKQAHEALGFKGIFYTSATGADCPNDQNCFAFPMRNGAWVVRRHGLYTDEHPAWTHDPSGWTRCYYNRPADLASASAAHGGVEARDGSWQFQEAADMVNALRDLAATGIHELPVWAQERPATLMLHPKQPSRLVVTLARQESDQPLKGWLPSRKGQQWECIATIELDADGGSEPPDDVVRHVVSGGAASAWYVKTRTGWISEPRANVVSVMLANGLKRPQIDVLLGLAVQQHWELVSLPFQQEYPGGRRWNRDAPQLAVEPQPGEHPTWDALLRHVGAGLNEAMLDDDEVAGRWCLEHGLTHGGDYLRCWVASLIQEPLEPLPYLFFYGPQATGKSTFHEALALLLRDRRGYVRADTALTSGSRFNGELAGAVLCVVEETNLRQSRMAYNRLKDWVTGRTISIHIKGVTPIELTNTTHWVQCANHAAFCPVLPGDTRITVIYVDGLDSVIPKSSLLAALRVEAPAFLDTILRLELPPPTDRLRIPVLMTADKSDVMESNEPLLDIFLREMCVINDEATGHALRLSDLYDAFQTWLPAEQRQFWTQARVRRALPPTIPRGRYTGAGYSYLGNIALKNNGTLTPLPKLVRHKKRLVEVTNEDT